MANRIPTALTDPTAIYLSLGVAISMYLIVINLKQDKPLDKKMIHFLSQTNLIFDAIGLAIFALIGASTGSPAKRSNQWYSGGFDRCRRRNRP